MLNLLPNINARYSGALFCCHTRECLAHSVHHIQLCCDVVRYATPSIRFRICSDYIICCLSCCLFCLAFRDTCHYIKGMFPPYRLVVENQILYKSSKLITLFLPLLRLSFIVIILKFSGLEIIFKGTLFVYPSNTEYL